MDAESKGADIPLEDQLAQARKEYEAAQARLDALCERMGAQQDAGACAAQPTPQPTPQPTAQPQPQPQPQPTAQQAYYAAPPVGGVGGQATSAGYETKDHVAAGLLALFLGTLGIHKFYLGYNTAGFIMLAITILGGLFLGLGAFAMLVVSVIEGIIYLTKSQSEFEQAYLLQERQWF